MLTVLVIDDNRAQLELVEASLSQSGVEIITCDNPVAGLDVVRTRWPKIVLLDLMMPQMGGMDVLEQIMLCNPAAEVVLVTGHYSTESAVEAIQKGASDYLTKPLDFSKLRHRIAVLKEDVQRNSETLRLDRELRHNFEFAGIVSRSPLMLEILAKMKRIAPHYRAALISGATGTGKELVARALHQLSPVASKTFAVCNCAALVDTLLESELFGHMKGAFTGATQDKLGLFEFANGGTVFLDEIGEMPLVAQAKLLRVLQNQEVQRVGSPLVRKIDVRIIAATNRNLSAMVEEGRFREDLYYRLSMVDLSLPALRDRTEDLPLLQRHFIEKFSRQYGKEISGITRRAQAVLASYRWPGNIRELENTIGNACMMTDSPVVDLRDLPPQLLRPRQPETDDTDLLTFEELQRRHLMRVLQRVGGDKTRAAEIVGVSRATIYAMLGKLKSSNTAASASMSA